MTGKPVVALIEVQADLEHAKIQYASWRTGGAAHVLEKYDETVGGIETNPERFPCKYGPIQRAILERSFYIAYFIQEPDRSVVLAVLDGRRSPVTIRGILGERVAAQKAGYRPAM
ncbi:MAG: hypothetical protein Q8N18_06095 [Opitutaceae bacterium]|nr:hypothetical protein [Opitutaceae bacterium]